MDSPSPPPAPDPKETAAAQATANVETAIAQAHLNRVNETTPFGTVTYSPSGEIITVGTGSDAQDVEGYNRTTTLSPAQQELYDTSQAMSKGLYGLGNEQIGRIRDAVADPFTFEGMPDAPSINDFQLESDRVADAMYGRSTRYMDPHWDQEMRRLETSLINAGHARGDEGYNRAMDDLYRMKDRAYEQARDTSVLAGRGEQSRLFGLSAAERDRAISEYASLRNQPINELAAVLGNAGGVAIPKGSPISQTGVSPTDVIGATYASYNADLARYQAQQASSGGLMSGLFGLGSAAIGAISDRRLKTDIVEIGKTVLDLPLYVYRYLGDVGAYVGVMAQDVLEVLPAAVVLDPSGFYRVRYDMLGIDLLRLKQEVRHA
jgi:hypothetical protein